MVLSEAKSVDLLVSKKKDLFSPCASGNEFVSLLLQKISLTKFRLYFFENNIVFVKVDFFLAGRCFFKEIYRS